MVMYETLLTTLGAIITFGYVVEKIVNHFEKKIRKKRLDAVISKMENINYNDRLFSKMREKEVASVTCQRKHCKCAPEGGECLPKRRGDV